MTLYKRTCRAERYEPVEESDVYDRIRHAAALKLCQYSEQGAGGGSSYIEVGDIKIRFANHENTSWQHDQPDYNCINRHLTDAEADEIVNRLRYPKLAKKTAFAMHVGLTCPKLLIRPCWNATPLHR
jgi:hypothetical protein